VVRERRVVVAVDLRSVVVVTSPVVVGGADVELDGRVASEPSTDAGAVVAGGVDTRVGPERCPINTAAPIRANPPSNKAMPMLRVFATPVRVACMRMSTRHRNRDTRSRTLARFKRWSARGMDDNATWQALRAPRTRDSYGNGATAIARTS
jgi:hypothetical protein